MTEREYQRHVHQVRTLPGRIARTRAKLRHLEAEAARLCVPGAAKDAPQRRDWTPAREQLVRAMWGRGATAGQIALALGGVSRNAVLGKAHRLGLAKRPSPLAARECER